MLTHEPAPPPPSNFVRTSMLLAIGIVAFIIVAVIYRQANRDGIPVAETNPKPVEPAKPIPDSAMPDPRVEYATDYRNVKPNVKYVSDASCNTCHAAISHTYHQHPMGRSAAPVSDPSVREPLDRSVQNPFQSDAVELAIVEDAKKIIHRLATSDPKDVSALSMPIDFVIGSGTRGRSYLSQDQSAVWQSPISWFTKDHRWNLSPGFRLSDGGQRPITADCLYCHVNQAEPIGRTVNQFRPIKGPLSIGCERCHGPGEIHVDERSRGINPTGRDTSIVNPKWLETGLKGDVCRQCHFIGEGRVTHFGRDRSDYRPGLPLSQVISLFVKHPDLPMDDKSVGQFEQMERSKCFTTSGTMTCVSCHDPHRKPTAELRVAEFRQKCLTCHSEKGCNQTIEFRKTAQDSCIDCHMPRKASSTIAHASVTDHRIPRKPTSDPNESVRPRPDLLPIVPYWTGANAPREADTARDLAIAMIRRAQRSSDPKSEVPFLQYSVDLLVPVVDKWDTDDQAWQALASAYSQLGDRQSRLLAARKAVLIAPNSESALVALAETELYSGQFDPAAQTVDRLIQISPTSLEYRLLRVSVRIGQKKWSDGDAASQEAIRINSISAEAHALRAICLKGLNRNEDAKRELDIALKLESNPQVRQQYKSWIQMSTR